MYITDVRLTSTRTHKTLSAKISSDSRKITRVVYFRINLKDSTFVRYSADPFLTSMLYCAMRNKEDLFIDGEISSKLNANVNKIISITSRWSETDLWDKLYKIKVKANKVFNKTPDIIGKTDEALFFTLGVDSFYSLKKLLEKRYSNFNYLIYVVGLDIKLSNKKLLNKVIKNIENVANTYGLKMIIVETNIRDITDKFHNWNAVHGEVLAGVGQFVSGEISKVYLSSSDSQLSKSPYGLHPDIDKLWSSDNLKVETIGNGIKRSEKIQFIKNFYLAQKYLRVCWENPQNRYNCSKCEKCLRTMLQLDAAHSLGKFKTFNKVPYYQLLNVIIEPKQRLFLWKDLLLNLPFPRSHARFIIIKLLIRSYRKLFISKI